MHTCCFTLVRDIATAIRDLLDAVNEVFKKCPNVGRMSQYKEVSYYSLSGKKRCPHHAG